MWARGDFHRIGVSQLVVGELLVRALHVHAGERVLDVATVLAVVEPGQAAAFTGDWLDLAEQHNAATDGTCEIPSAYLQVAAVKLRPARSA